MMEWGILVPVAAIIGGPIAWVATTWIRARHGYPVETEKSALIDRNGVLADNRKIELLMSENDKLRGTIGRLEERVSVLERIATDKPGRLSDEIAALVA